MGDAQAQQVQFKFVENTLQFSLLGTPSSPNPTSCSKSSVIKVPMSTGKRELTVRQEGSFEVCHLGWAKKLNPNPKLNVSLTTAVYSVSH